MTRLLQRRLHRLVGFDAGRVVAPVPEHAAAPVSATSAPTTSAILPLRRISGAPSPSKICQRFKRMVQPPAPRAAQLAGAGRDLVQHEDRQHRRARSKRPRRQRPVVGDPQIVPEQHDGRSGAVVFGGGGWHRRRGWVRRCGCFQRSYAAPRRSGLLRPCISRKRAFAGEPCHRAAIGLAKRRHQNSPRPLFP
jgi:hypothetical protein